MTAGKNRRGLWGGAACRPQAGAPTACPLSAVAAIPGEGREGEIGRAQWLQALACGAPVAAFPVTGPIDVIGDRPIGAIDHNLRAACLRALTMSRKTCRSFALERSWENSARQFLGNLMALQPSRSLRPVPRVAGQSAVQG